MIGIRAGSIRPPPLLSSSELASNQKVRIKRLMEMKMVVNSSIGLSKTGKSNQMEVDYVILKD